MSSFDEVGGAFQLAVAIVVVEGAHGNAMVEVSFVEQIPFIVVFFPQPVLFALAVGLVGLGEKPYGDEKGDEECCCSFHGWKVYRNNGRMPLLISFY